VRLNERWNMSGGLRVIGSRITANLASLDNVQAGDPNFSQNINSGFYLNMGMGLLVYDESSFFGLSIPKAIMREFEGQQILNAKMKQHMFAYGGTSIAFNELWTLSPSVMLRFVKDSPFQFDVNAVMNYKNTFDFGPMLRSLDAVGMLVGMRFNEQWYLGYQYEFPLQAIQQVTRQTHEISLRFLWDSKYKTRIRSPRYFI
jgi:type IX secretion system PorP/SprF family membrane protein